MIAKLHENEGVCLEGRFAGWLMRRHPDGHWVSVRKLATEAPTMPDVLGKLINAKDAS